MPGRAVCRDELPLLPCTRLTHRKVHFCPQDIEQEGEKTGTEKCLFSPSTSADLPTKHVIFKRVKPKLRWPPLYKRAKS